MSFSGQYAAAQLHHLPLPHTLLNELSDYLGCAPNFAPPTYVAWVRAHGRLPTDDEDVYGRTFYANMLPSDFRNNNFGRATVMASTLRLDYRGLLNVERMHFMAHQVRPALFHIRLQIDARCGDIYFMRRWSDDRRAAWPDTSSGVHPAIAGAVRIYWQHGLRVRAYNLAQYEIQRRHNMRLEV